MFTQILNLRIKLPFQWFSLLAIAAIIQSYHYFKSFSFSNDGIVHILAVVVIILNFTIIAIVFLSQMMQLPLF